MTTYSFGAANSRPHTRIELDASQLGSSGSSTDKVLAIVGSATSGVPGVLYTLNSLSEARQIFRSGDIVDAIEIAYNPSPNVRGAGRIMAMRVENAKPATYENGALTFTSRIHGSEANDIQISLQENSETDAKRMRVFFSRDRYQMTYENIGRVFQIKYTGESAEAATMTIEKNTHGMARTLRLSVDGQSVVTYDLGIGVYENINVLVNDINDRPDFEAMFFAEGDKNLKSEQLDAMQNVDITENVVVSAVAGDIARVLQWSEIVNVEVDYTQSVSTFGITKLSGGSDGEVPVSWAEKLEGLYASGAYYIVPLTASPTIHGEVAALVSESAQAGNEMRTVVGGGIGEGLNQTLTRRVQLNNPLVALAGVSGKRSLTNGRQIHMPAYMVASAIAGIAAGGSVGEPVTYKSLILDEIDQKYTNTELDRLHDNGVIAVEFVRNRAVTQFRIVSDVTTFNDKSEPIKAEMSLGELTDFLFSDLRYVLDNEFIGTKLTIQAPSLLKNRVQSYLEERTRDPLSEITEFNPEDVQVVIQGDSAVISFVVTPARGLNRILVRGVYSQADISA